jgi:hypothetical protein
MLAMLPLKDFLSRTLGLTLVRRSCAWSVGFLVLGAACADLHAPPSLGDAGAANQAGAGGMSGGQTSSAAGTTSSTIAGSAVISGSGGSQAGSTGSTESGNAGSGGDVGAAGQSCASLTSGDVHAWLYRELEDARSNELHPFFALTTTGADIPLKRLAIRYYFTAELQGDWELTCIWVTKQSASTGALCDNGTSLKIEALDPPQIGADHYLEVSFPGVSEAEALSNGQMPAFEARTMFWRTDHPTQRQDNDYSFVPTTDNVMTVEGRQYRETAKVTVYRDGELIWGTEPCP